LSLLGVAGSAAAAVAVGWLSPLLIALSVALLGRSFWVLYVQKRGSRFVMILTWLSAGFVICFWTYQLFLKKGGG
jgi:hypothetical protein